MGWSRRGCLMGPSGRSVVAHGADEPAEARDGDVWLVAGEDGSLESVAVYREEATSPSAGTYPSGETYPHGKGWIENETEGA